MRTTIDARRALSAFADVSQVTLVTFDRALAKKTRASFLLEP
jgi:hypothetical protein